jgi:endonuclease/exonuclease/phosphatase family metal-dependent hydrolase
MKKLSLLLLVVTSISWSQNLKLMTYNIRLDVASDGLNAWSYRKDFMGEQIKEVNPDIIGFQEALPHQINELLERLSNYQKSGIGREINGIGEASCIFFNPSKFELQKEATFWLSETPNEVSKGWDAACNRVCSYVLLKDRVTQKSFWVFNTHLDHVGEVARDKGIELILQTIANQNTQNLPVIFMGDFNSLPSTQRIIHLKSLLLDAYDVPTHLKSGPIATFNGFQNNYNPNDRIDYIFMSPKKCTVKNYTVLVSSREKRFPSDHFPVYIEIELHS